MRSMTPVVNVAVLSVLVACHACSAQETAESVALQGTFIRPAEGIEHPDLDQAWTVYRDAVEDVTSDVARGLDARIKAEQERGRLDAVLRLQAGRDLFTKEGVFPALDFVDADTHAGAARTIRGANSRLMDGYRSLAGTLTKLGDIPKATSITVERDGVELGLGFPPIPNVPEPMFDGKQWDDWGQGWGPGQHKVKEEQKAIELIKEKYFNFQRLVRGDIAFEVEVRRRDDNAMVQVALEGDGSSCVIRIPERDKKFNLIQDWGDVIRYEHAANREEDKANYAIPKPRKGPWLKIRLTRVDGNLTVYIDGKQVHKRPLPPGVVKDCRPCIGVWNGNAEFRNLTLTRIVVPNAAGAGGP